MTRNPGCGSRPKAARRKTQLRKRCLACLPTNRQPALPPRQTDPYFGRTNGTLLKALAMRAHLLQDTTLRYFLEVAHSGSLTEASARLHVAASALCRPIAGLEAQLGTPLFERHPRGMVLTAAGENLAIHARRTVLDAERALGEIRPLQRLRAPPVPPAPP